MVKMSSPMFMISWIEYVNCLGVHGRVSLLDTKELLGLPRLWLAFVGRALILDLSIGPSNCPRRAVVISNVVRVVSIGPLAASLLAHLRKSLICTGAVYGHVSQCLVP
jgi:hypothetical protein